MRIKDIEMTVKTVVKTWDTGNKKLNRMGTTSMFVLLQPIMSQSTESLQLIPKTLTDNSESPHLI